MEIFCELLIGGTPKDTLLQELRAAGVQFNDSAQKLFAHPGFNPDHAPQKLKLIKTSMGEFGLEGPQSLQTILDHAAARGLRPCPLHTAAHLRLQYRNQREGPYLTVASPPPESEADPAGFYVRNRDQILWLRGYRVDGTPEWPKENEFVFQV